MKAASAIALAAVTALLVPGCLEPFRARVPAEVLASAPGWVETPGGVEGSWYGQKRVGTRYAFDRQSDDPPPFPGVLEVYSLRRMDDLSRSELERQARRLVAGNAEAYLIELEANGPEGSRKTAGGVTTHWFVLEGRTTQQGALFDQDVGVRFLAEFGTDGRSSTSFIAVGLAQVSRTNLCPFPLPGNCQPEESNLQTWIQVVGDPEGTIQGATSSTGFLDRLVTR